MILVLKAINTENKACWENYGTGRRVSRKLKFLKQNESGSKSDQRSWTIVY